MLGVGSSVFSCQAKGHAFPYPQLLLPSMLLQLGPDMGGGAPPPMSVLSLLMVVSLIGS